MEVMILKIKCPHCGSVLSVKNEPGLNEKSTTCPVCKQKSQIKDFERIADRLQEKTEYPSDHPGKEPMNERTTINNNNYPIGRLEVFPNGPSHQLRPGRTIIGRLHNEGEHADFEIATNSKRMSRLHLVIDVKKVPGTGFQHYASLYGQKANATFIGNNRLEVGDCLVLNDGDVIRLPDQPDINVRFVIPDSEKTEID